MQRKWPLDLPLSSEAIRAKVADLLSHKGEWTALERHALKSIATEADEIVRIADASRTAHLTENDAIRAMALRYGAGIQANMFHAYEDDEITVRSSVADALALAGRMTSDIVAGIRRSPSPALGNLVDGYASDMGHELVDAILADCDEKRSEEFERATKALEALREDNDDDDDCDDKPDAHEDGGTPEVDEELRRDVRAALARRNTQRRYRAHREIQDWTRAVDRIQTIFERAVAAYGVPERLAPRREAEWILEDDRFVYVWGAGLPLPGEPAIDEDDPRWHMLPNGVIKMPYNLGATGEIDPYLPSFIAAEVQRIVLIAGRDVEIDGFMANLAAPPPWCLAAATPVANMIRTAKEDDGGQWIEAAGAVVECTNKQLDENGIASISSRPLLEGTSIAYFGEIPDVIRIALQKRTGIPVMQVVDHPALRDERILIGAVTIEEDESVVFHLDCPVERLVPHPQGLDGIDPDPIAAWTDFGQRLMVDDFYRRMSEVQVATRLAALQSASGETKGGNGYLTEIDIADG